MNENSKIVLSFASKQQNVNVAQKQVNQLSLISLPTLNILSTNFLALKSKIIFQMKFKSLLMIHRSFAIREFKKLRRRRQGQCQMNLYFTYESHDTLKSFTLFITVRTITKLNLGHSDKLEIEI